MRWTDVPIHFIDFEGSRASGVLEYGIATLLGGKVVETRTRRCRPTGRVRAEDTAVHRLREEDLAALPPLADDWETFAGLRERGPFAAHYAGTENGLLKSVWPYPRQSPDFARPGESAAEWGPWIDTARIFSNGPAGAAGRLEAVVGAAGLQGELDALAEGRCPPDRRFYHAALYDALAGALVLSTLARDPRWAACTVMHLCALSTQNPAKREGLAQRRLW